MSNFWGHIIYEAQKKNSTNLIIINASISIDMKTNKIQRYFSGIIAILCLFFMYSCESKESKTPSEIIGTWSDTDIQSATESHRYLSLKLYEDGSGDLHFESLAYLRIASFTWTFKNNIVTCTGTMIETTSDGETYIDSEWVGTFKYTGTALIPQNSPYKDFILTLYGGDSSDSSDSGDKEDQESNPDFEYAVGINYMATSGNTHLIPLVWSIPSGMRSKGLSEFGIAIKCLNGKITNKNGHEDGMHTKSIGSYKYFHTSVQDNKTDFSVIMYVTSSDTNLEFELYPHYILKGKEIDGNSVKKNINLNNDRPNNSSGHTANCYIVSSAGTYELETVKGNSSESVGDVSYAEVLWESFGTDKKPNIGDLVSKVTYKNGKIQYSITSPFKEGNVVIAAKDASGTILWSWHIWLTDEPKEQIYYNNAGTMMDRNLGATSSTPGSVEALGLLFQWGRKDPFLGSSSINNDTIAEGTISWPSAVESSNNTGSIEYSIRNPMTYITGWNRNDSSTNSDSLWNSSKTIYDPCPYGWRVPDGGNHGVWVTACETSTIFDWLGDADNKGMNFSGKFGNASIIWYPYSGSRYPGSGTLHNTGDQGDYWSVSPYNRNNFYSISFNDEEGVAPSTYWNPAYGFAIRCQKE